MVFSSRTPAHDEQKLRCDTRTNARRHPTYGCVYPVDVVPFPSADGAIHLLLSDSKRKASPKADRRMPFYLIFLLCRSRCGGAIHSVPQKSEDSCNTRTSRQVGRKFKKWAQYSFYRFASLQTGSQKRAPFTYKSNFYPRIVPAKIIYFLLRWILSVLWDVYFGRMGLKNRSAVGWEVMEHENLCGLQ